MHMWSGDGDRGSSTWLRGHCHNRWRGAKSFALSPSLVVGHMHGVANDARRGCVAMYRPADYCCGCGRVGMNACGVCAALCVRT